MTKQQFRQEAFAVRDGIDVGERERLSSQACETVKPLLKEANAVMLYSPIRSELDVSSLFDWLWQQEVITLLPVMTKQGLVAAVYDKDTAFSKGAYSIAEPVFDKPFSPGDIDVVIVPGIAFTSAGDRMGYGAGYYDRFLPQTNARRIGICFPQQVYDTIPIDEYDVKLEKIVAANNVYSAEQS